MPLSTTLAGLVHSPLFIITLTLLAYVAGTALYKLSNKYILLHPIITSATVIALTIYSLSIEYRTYLQHTDILYFLMGPATVALAIPLHQQFHHIKSFLFPILIGITFGVISATASTILFALCISSSAEVILSLAPKTVTTPIAISIIEITGGNPSLTAGVVVLTGVAGTIMASAIFSICKITDHRIMGFTLGLAAHGIGTARAFDISEEAGAFASLALGLTGVIMAILLPLLTPWLIR